MAEGLSSSAAGSTRRGGAGWGESAGAAAESGGWRGLSDIWTARLEKEGTGLLA
jgi:hypothetical protein